VVGVVGNGSMGLGLTVGVKVGVEVAVGTITSKGTAAA